MSNPICQTLSILNATLIALADQCSMPEVKRHLLSAQKSVVLAHEAMHNELRSIVAETQDKLAALPTN